MSNWGNFGIMVFCVSVKQVHTQVKATSLVLLHHLPVVSTAEATSPNNVGSAQTLTPAGPIGCVHTPQERGKCAHNDGGGVGVLY